jgi:hypothetical protein
MACSFHHAERDGYLGKAMSLDLIVYLSRAAMPTPVRWAQAIRDAGFPVELDFSDFDPDTSTGFRPCKFRGILTGFECSTHRLSESERQERGAPSGCDFEVLFNCGAAYGELISAVIAASVLCQMTGGTLVDPQEAEEYRASGVLQWARDLLSEFEKDPPRRP